MGEGGPTTTSAIELDPNILGRIDEVREILKAKAKREEQFLKQHPNFAILHKQLLERENARMKMPNPKVGSLELFKDKDGKTRSALAGYIRDPY